MGNSKRAKSPESRHKKSIVKSMGLRYLEKIFPGPIKGEDLKSITRYYLASRNNRTSASVAILLSEMSGSECTKKQVIENQVLRYLRDSANKAKKSCALTAKSSDKSKVEHLAECGRVSVVLQNKIFDEMQMFIKEDSKRQLEDAGEHFIEHSERLLKEPSSGIIYTALSTRLLTGIYNSAKNKIRSSSGEVETAEKANGY